MNNLLYYLGDYTISYFVLIVPVIILCTFVNDVRPKKRRVVRMGFRVL